MRKKTLKVSRKRSDTSQARFSEERGNEKMERAQIWSIDVLLAVVIFISIMIIFYVTINAGGKPNIKDLQAEATFLRTEFEENPDLAFISDDIVNSTLLDSFVKNTADNYEAVREGLGIRGDFCIYLEDEQGNLVLLTDNRTGIGSGDINISDTPCGQVKW